MPAIAPLESLWDEPLLADESLEPPLPPPVLGDPLEATTVAPGELEPTPVLAVKPVGVAPTF